MRGLLRCLAGFFLRALAGEFRFFPLFLLASGSLFLLDPQPILFQLLGLEALLLLATLAIQLGLLFLRLFLEHIALDIGPFAADLDIDRARPALGARQTQFGLRLAFQGDAAWRGNGR